MPPSFTFLVQRPFPSSLFTIPRTSTVLVWIGSTRSHHPHRVRVLVWLYAYTWFVVDTTAVTLHAVVATRFGCTLPLPFGLVAVLRVPLLLFFAVCRFFGLHWFVGFADHVCPLVTFTCHTFAYLPSRYRFARSLRLPHRLVAVTPHGLFYGLVSIRTLCGLPHRFVCATVWFLLPFATHGSGWFAVPLYGYIAGLPHCVYRTFDCYVYLPGYIPSLHTHTPDSCGYILRTHSPFVRLFPPTLPRGWFPLPSPAAPVAFTPPSTPTHTRLTLQFLCPHTPVYTAFPRLNSRTYLAVPCPHPYHLPFGLVARSPHALRLHLLFTVRGSRFTLRSRYSYCTVVTPDVGLRHICLFTGLPCGCCTLTRSRLRGTRTHLRFVHARHVPALHAVAAFTFPFCPRSVLPAFTHPTPILRAGLHYVYVCRTRLHLRFVRCVRLLAVLLRVYLTFCSVGLRYLVLQLTLPAPHPTVHTPPPYILPLYPVCSSPHTFLPFAYYSIYYRCIVLVCGSGCTLRLFVTHTRWFTVYRLVLPRCDTTFDRLRRCNHAWIFVYTAVTTHTPGWFPARLVRLFTGYVTIHSPRFAAARTFGYGSVTFWFKFVWFHAGCRGWLPDIHGPRLRLLYALPRLPVITPCGVTL